MKMSFLFIILFCSFSLYAQDSEPSAVDDVVARSEKPSHYIEKFTYAYPGLNRFSFNYIEVRGETQSFSNGDKTGSISDRGHTKSLEYERGLELFSLGANLSYIDRTRKTASSNNALRGLEDFEVFLHKRLQRFYFRASFFTPLEEPLEDGFEEFTRPATGEHFQFHFGYLFGNSWGIIARFRPAYFYDLEIDSPALAVPVDIRIEKGTQLILELFKEFPLSSHILLGFEAAWLRTSDGKQGSVVVETPEQVAAGVYSAFRFGKLDLLLNYSIQRLKDNQSDNGLRVNYSSLGGKLRFNF